MSYKMRKLKCLMKLKGKKKCLSLKLKTNMNLIINTKNKKHTETLHSKTTIKLTVLITKKIISFKVLMVLKLALISLWKIKFKFVKMIKLSNSFTHSTIFLRSSKLNSSIKFKKSLKKKKI